MGAPVWTLVMYVCVVPGGPSARLGSPIYVSRATSSVKGTNYLTSTRQATAGLLLKSLSLESNFQSLISSPPESSAGGGIDSLHGKGASGWASAPLAGALDRSRASLHHMVVEDHECRLKICIFDFGFRWPRGEPEHDLRRPEGFHRWFLAWGGARSVRPGRLSRHECNIWLYACKGWRGLDGVLLEHGAGVDSSPVVRRDCATRLYRPGAGLAARACRIERTARFHVRLMPDAS